MFMVMLTAPLGLVGVVPMLLTFLQPFGFNAILGMIGLAGILHIGRSSYRVGQGLFDGECCFGSAECLMVMIDSSTRHPTPIDEGMRARLGAYRIP